MEFLRIILSAVAGAVLLLLFPVSARAQAPEYQVKAAMLYRFALFVEWPAREFSTDTSPFVVCVLGKNPFGSWLRQEMGETRVGTHPVEIRRMEKAEAARGCHMVFISRSEEGRLKQALDPLRNASVLIISDVSDINEFCLLGGMIGLVMEDDKVRFELNSKAAEQAGLKIDSRLKRIAKSAECGGAP